MILLLQAAQTAFALSYPLFNYIYRKQPKELDLKVYYYHVAIAGVILFAYFISNIRSYYVQKPQIKKVLNFIKLGGLFPAIPILVYNLISSSSVTFWYKILLFLSMVLVFVITAIADTPVCKYGLKDVFFSVLLVPSLFLSTNIILSNEVDFESLMKFGPVNFLFLGVLLCFGSRKDVVLKNEAAGVWSLATLLGKQDSFRALFLIIAYCYLHGIIESINDLSLK